MSLDVLAIIPARGGSKGIPGKNLAPCAGQPLVGWTVAAANNSKYVSRAVLSSDDHDILRCAYGKTWPYERPAAFATDEATTESVIADVLASIREPGVTEADAADIVVLLQPTSPLRNARHIDEAVELLLRTGADSVVSVVPSHAFLWGADGPKYAERKRRQDMEPQFEENGAIYVCTMEHWRRTGDRLGGHVELYVMPEEHRTQVDVPFDLAVCSLLLEREAIEEGAVA